MKKALYVIYCALILTICGVFLAIMPFADSGGDIEKSGSSAFPAPVADGKINESFSDEFESWLNTSLPFRSSLVTVADYIKSDLLHSPAANVIRGRDGWLFFAETANDYVNSESLTSRDARKIAITLSLLQESTESRGGRFLFVPVPNKNTVYGKYMPARYRQADNNSIETLYDALDQAGVAYTDLMAAFRESDSDIPLYLRRDTHWNNIGALVAYQAMMDTLGKTDRMYSDVTYTPDNTWQSDLDKLLYPADTHYDTQYTLSIPTESFRFLQPAGVQDAAAQLEVFMSDREEGDHRFRTSKMTPTDGSCLYMVRDSFGRALLPMMIHAYDTATFVRTERPDMNAVGENTDMIYEIAQRNLSSIISTAPYMMAPRRENVAVTSTVNAAADVVAKDEGYAYRLYGTVDSSLAEGRVFIRLQGGDTDVTYEAFPITEAELPEEAKGQDGFSLFLDPADIPSGTYTAFLVTEDGASVELSTIIFGQ